MKLTTRLVAVALGLLFISALPAAGSSSPLTNIHRDGGGPVPPWKSAHDSNLSNRDGGGPVPPWQGLPAHRA